MYRGLRCVLIVPVFNEEAYIGEVIRRVPQIVDTVLVVDDGSTDGSVAIARQLGAEVLSLPATIGVGAALREGFEWAAAREFDVIAVCAGNNKDAPEELPLEDEPLDARVEHLDARCVEPGRSHCHHGIGIPPGGVDPSAW